jgi:hypothetical protein
VRSAVVLAAVMAGLSFHARLSFGEDLFQYREYALQSSLSSVAKIGGVDAAEARMLHERPVKLQELRWRAPYAAADATAADPVRDVLFSFYDDQLYQIIVTYERGRVEGLTDADLIESLSAAYGAPVLTNGKVSRAVSPGAELPSDTVSVARWEKGSSSVMLVRGTFSPGLQLVLTSKPLYARARTAAADSLTLEAREAPQRELDQRKKDAAAATATKAKVRGQNKAAFRH